MKFCKILSLEIDEILGLKIVASGNYTKSNFKQKY